VYYESDLWKTTSNPQERLERFISDVNAFVRPAGRVLSVGCGYGLNEIVLSFLSPEAEIVGIDILDDKGSDAKIRSMKWIAAWVKAERVTAVLADGGRLPFRGEVFDCVLAIDCLSHADYTRDGRALEENQAVMLAEMSRSLRAGGQLAVVENSAASPRNVMRKGRTACHPVNPFYLKTTLEGLGYENIQVVPYYDLTERRDVRARLLRALLRRSNTIGLFLAPFFMLSARKEKANGSRVSRPPASSQ